MSYAQRKQLAGNPALAWFFTAAVVGGLMYAIVTGLAYNVVKKSIENLKVIDVEEQPPPPEQPPASWLVLSTLIPQVPGAGVNWT